MAKSSGGGGRAGRFTTRNASAADLYGPASLEPEFSGSVLRRSSTALLRRTLASAQSDLRGNRSRSSAAQSSNQISRNVISNIQSELGRRGVG